ncbi:LOW QUALITY PROTEIN: AT-rich interactive domain-containing protein 3-like [Pyrus x bretschneideri]|uniref:LOW QUALITY PROTEIN: AT-rich interactive domain-containing protein 3-like n=1 Tax=Pyrus x bretschneideri TaxID=225117 RepID=UPI00202F0DBD|nr:LOW QUALITY PROTEIN: AT-rich interactive domain-containing protein 3-like [Pyrus x bretschneideri]
MKMVLNCLVMTFRVRLIRFPLSLRLVKMLTLLTPCNELDSRNETDKVASNVDSGVHCESEVSVKIVREESGGVKGEALKDDLGSKVNPSIELGASGKIGSLVGDGGSPHTEDPMEIEREVDGVEEEKALKDGVSSEANPSNEADISYKTDDVACEMQLDMPHDSEAAMEKLTDEATSEANPSSETRIGDEIDNIVSTMEPGMPCDSEVAAENLIDGESNKGKSSNEPDRTAETDNVVRKAELDTHESEVEPEKLKDGVTSEVPNIIAEDDNAACKVEPGMPCDIEVATEKLIEQASNKAKSSNEPDSSAETGNVVGRVEVEPDMPCDSECATEKLTDKVSSEVNPSSELHINAEADNAICKAETDKMSHDSGVGMKKLIGGLNIKANPSSEPHISAETDNVVSKVEPDMPRDNQVEVETESDDDGEKVEGLNGGVSNKTKFSFHTDINEQLQKPIFYVGRKVGMKSLEPKKTFLLDPGADEGGESGTEEEQASFTKEVINLYKEKNLEFKAPKFYKEELNLLKLWRAVIKLGGYDKVTTCKLWRQVGESFNPPKTCTTVSWTFRNFYEKALLEFERDRLNGGELPLPAEPTRVENRADGGQTLGSGRALRDAAARAMQGWHSHRHHGNNGEVGDAINKDKHLITMPKSDKQLKNSVNSGLLKRKKPSHMDSGIQVADMKATKPRMDTMVFDIGPPADWVKINVKRFNDCFEVYALVPGLLREEVHVQSDPAGRLIISGQPTQLDNPWGVTPFKKVVSLPSRIDPHQTSAVVTLNGQLFVRVPFEQSDF